MESWLSSLHSPSAYPESTQEVRLIQTHVSYIFITDSYAYKIKKGVNFGFLDFSTADKRKYYCDEEVRLNRRLCPEMYIGVVEVREAPGGAAFHGTGPVLDYAVKMKRLPEERMLDRLLDRGGVTEKDIRRIAKTIGTFHLQADHNREIDTYGDIGQIRSNWNENFVQTEPFIGATITRPDLEIIVKWSEWFMERHLSLFRDRIASGFIRDCNGDIHAENICLFPDRVCVFDCIEFNKRFRFIDTAADIAFFLMDLDYHSRSLLGDIFLDEYLRTTSDERLPEILGFYKVYRAFVRGKVESFRLNDPDIPDDEKEKAQNTARRYFRLARGYVLRERLPPGLIMFCGLMGSGKSTLASEMGFELGVEILSSDVIRKKMHGVAPDTRLFSGFRQGAYAPEQTRAVYDALLQRADEALSQGKAVIVDASFAKEEERRRFREMASAKGCRSYIIYTQCDEPEARRRLDSRLATGNASDGRWEIYHQQRQEFQQPDPAEGRLLTINTCRPATELVDEIISFLGGFDVAQI